MLNIGDIVIWNKDPDKIGAVVTIRADGEGGISYDISKGMWVEVAEAFIPEDHEGWVDIPPKELGVICDRRFRRDHGVNFFADLPANKEARKKAKKEPVKKEPAEKEPAEKEPAKKPVFGPEPPPKKK